MNRKLRTAAPAAAALSLALVLAACGSSSDSEGTTDTPATDGGSSDVKLSGTLNGAGASSQEAAVAAWKAGFQGANPDVTVNYDPAGSGAGREQFIAGGVAFAGTDSYLDDEELAAATAKCGGDIVEVPTYVSPIAVIYNLDGVDDLKLSPQTIGAIFEGTITKWNDDAIATDNPDADLPDTSITAVHRSDDSGTTKNFTDYLAKASDGGWTGDAVSTWPTSSGEAAEGTSGVVAAVKAAQGAIGYADESQAGDLGKAQVKVGDAFVEVSAEAAAKVLETATPVAGRAATDLAVDIDRSTSEAGVYPIVLVSYMVTCQTSADADLVKGWFTYVTGEDGQAAAAEAAGSAELPTDFAGKVKTAIDTITAG